MNMPNVIANLANQYAYERDVSSTDKDVGASVRLQKSGEVWAEQPPADVKELVSKVENLTQLVQRNLEFSVDEETGQQVIRVIDTDTGELVRQIPPDQILHVISQVQKANEGVSSGILLDDTV